MNDVLNQKIIPPLVNIVLSYLSDSFKQIYNNKIKLDYAVMTVQVEDDLLQYDPSLLYYCIKLFNKKINLQVL